MITTTTGWIFIFATNIIFWSMIWEMITLIGKITGYACP